MSIQTIDEVVAPSRRFPTATELGRRIAQAIRHRLMIYRTRRELCALSDFELADIGITRCDINHVAQSETDWHFQRGRGR